MGHSLSLKYACAHIIRPHIATVTLTAHHAHFFSLGRQTWFLYFPSFESICHSSQVRHPPACSPVELLLAKADVLHEEQLSRWKGGTDIAWRAELLRFFRQPSVRL